MILPPDAAGIARAAEILRGGGLVALPTETVYGLAAREGWNAKYCKRGGQFGVIEIWIDGCQMIEVLTPEMQREYLDCVTVANWRALIGSGPLEELAA